jgi:hypothetical protein
VDATCPGIGLTIGLGWDRAIGGLDTRGTSSTTIS